MIPAILTAAAAFAASNIDDLFMLVLLFTLSKNSRRTVLGYTAAVLSVAVLSLLGAGGLSSVAAEYIRFLGIVPLCLGIHAAVKPDDDDMPVIPAADKQSDLINAFLFTLAGSADNLGIYIPLFAAQRSLTKCMATIFVTAMMAMLWCKLAKNVAALPALAGIIRRRKRWLVPAVYVLLGLFILLG